MAPLSQASIQALDRLRAYQAPKTAWADVPLSRRAAVLILLFADRKGGLRVLVTMRAATLRSYTGKLTRLLRLHTSFSYISFPHKYYGLYDVAGQAALPGGKAEAGETPFETARREASEEIGLPRRESALPPPFRIEHLCEMPTNLAKTELVVRPCVAFMHSHDPETGLDADVAKNLLPRLDSREVAAVFSMPFKNLLYSEDSPDELNLPGKPQDWYKGSWTDWHQVKWRMHQFFVPVTNQVVSRPKITEGQKVAKDHLDGKKRYRVFGMTARILVDCARYAYDKEPQFEHNSHFGDEDMIGRLRRIGKLGPIHRKTDELTKEDLAKAAKL